MTLKENYEGKLQILAEVTFSFATLKKWAAIAGIAQMSFNLVVQKPQSQME